MYLVGLIISISSITLNSTGVSILSDYNCDSSYSYEFGTTCTGNKIIILNYVQIALSVLCFVLCLIFLCVVGRIVGFSRQPGYYRGMRRYNSW